MSVSTNSIAYNVRITDPEVLTFLLKEAGDDSSRFEALIKRVMTSSTLPMTTVAQNTTAAVMRATEQPPATPNDTPSKKRKATGPVGRDFTEESVPEFIEKIVKDYLVMSDENDFVDMATIRGLFERVLAEEYSITRGAKGIIAKLLKPTTVNDLIADNLGVALEKSIKIKLDPVSFASIVPEEYKFEECADKKNMVTFKNIFLGVRLADGGSSATPYKPRTKKSKDSNEATSAEESVEEQVVSDSHDADAFEFRG